MTGSEPGRSAPYSVRMSRQLSQADLELIVRRATELHVAGGQPAAGDFDLDAARTVLREAGVSEEATEQALRDFSKGRLAHGLPVAAPAPRTRLEPTVCVARELPVPPERVADVFDAALRRQFFERGRRAGLGGDWVPKRGVVAKVGRKLNMQGKVLLRDIDRIRLEVRPVDAGHARVTVTAVVSTYRNAVATTLIGIPLVAAAGFGLGAIETTELVIGTPIGLLAAGGGYLGTGRLLEQRREQVGEALDVVLDRLV
jgi:hypothetical protein